MRGWAENRNIFVYSYYLHGENQAHSFLLSLKFDVSRVETQMFFLKLLHLEN